MNISTSSNLYFRFGRGIILAYLRVADILKAKGDFAPWSLWTSEFEQVFQADVFILFDFHFWVDIDIQHFMLRKAMFKK